MAGGKCFAEYNALNLYDAIDWIIIANREGIIAVSRFIEDQKTEKKPSEKREASLEGIITRDPGMLEVKEKILRISGTDSPVLITGETGTGKELVAQSIHYHGGRNRGPFVTLNCAAVPENLLESVLFGTVKGAFTGAENKQGLISSADKGVLFLDEIHMVPLGLQAKRLRFLEDYRVRRVGDTAEKPVDVRIVSAMNIDPMEALAKNLIRQDLFYRLSVVSIRLPSLKDRPVDIPVLTDHFIGLYNIKMNRSIKGVSELVMNLFMNFHWKGNVRELKHAIEGAFNLAKGDVITLKDLPEYMVNIKNPSEMIGFSANENLSLEEKVNAYEESLIRNSLAAGCTHAEAARKLGITRQSLRYKMEKYHMNLFFPQWQGAGQTDELYRGAMEIKEKYIKSSILCEIDVSTGENKEIENNILGYQTILEQLKQANRIISTEDPDRIFTIGGGCDVEISPVSYLNRKLEGDLTVLWIDAHGDLNTPESSPSKNFHGMPLRVLLGEGDPGTLAAAFSALCPEQMVMIGQRDLDEPEREYIEKKQNRSDPDRGRQLQR